MTKRIVVLTFEGLATSPIGAYGCSWLETPGFNRLAAAGVLFDRLYACSTDPLIVLRRYLSIEDSPTSVAKLANLLGMATQFFTDSPAAAELAEVQDFDQCTLIEPEASNTVATEVEDTALGQLFAAAVARQESFGSAPLLLWIHSAALVRTWDAPFVLRESEDLHVEDFDTAEPLNEFDSESIDTPSPGLAPEVIAALHSVAPPKVRMADNADPDLLIAWMTAYGAQVRLIDTLLEIAFSDTGMGENEHLLVGSTSGFTLGDQGWIGVEDHPPKSSRLHLPLLIRSPGLGPVRCGHPVLSHRLSTTIADWIQDAGAPSPESLMEELLPERWAAVCESTEPIYEIIDDLRQPGGALTTYRISPGWFYISNPDGREELYLKPDDRFDVNDVANLSPNVIEQFRAWQ